MKLQTFLASIFFGCVATPFALAQTYPPLSPFAITSGLNPISSGAPLANFSGGIASTVSGGVTDPLGFYMADGGIFAYKPMTWGTEDRGCGMSIIVNALPNTGSIPGDNAHCGVMGTLAYAPGRVADYTSRDSVGLYSANSSLPPVSVDPSGTFDSTHYYPSSGHILSSTQVGELRVGMLIDVGGIYSSSKYTGTITSWATNGTSISVSGWYQMGNDTAQVVPPNDTTTSINPISKIWAANFATDVEPGGAQDSTGIEMDVTNNSSPTSITATNQQWGYDAIGGGTYGGEDAFIARGQFINGFSSQTGAFANFIGGPEPAYEPGGSEYGFYSTGNILLADFHSGGTGVGNAYEAVNSSGATTFSVTHAGAGSFTGGLQVIGTTFLDGLTNIFTNLGGHASTGFGTVGGVQFGWNYTNGSGDADLILNQGAGGSGGLNVYQANSSGTIGSPVMSVSSGGNLSVPGVVSPANGVIVPPTILAPSSGSTVVLTVATPQVLIVNGGGSLAALTFTLPLSPSNGQKVTVTSLDGISTVSFTSGPTLWNAPTTLASGVSFTMEWSSYLSAWFKTGST